MTLSFAHSGFQTPTGDEFKQAMRRLAGGVSVITTGDGETRTGATVTSAHSFSADPPTMLVSLNLTSSTWTAVRRNGVFCVNLLEEAQQSVAGRFSGFGGLKGAERYEGAEWTRLLPDGAPALAHALAALDCAVEETLERHSHGLIFGRVRAIKIGSGAPLLYADGRYGGFL